jgi:hypothetical protein
LIMWGGEFPLQAPLENSSLRRRSGMEGGGGGQKRRRSGAEHSGACPTHGRIFDGEMFLFVLSVLRRSEV